MKHFPHGPKWVPGVVVKIQAHVQVLRKHVNNSTTCSQFSATDFGTSFSDVYYDQIPNIVTVIYY